MNRKENLISAYNIQASIKHTKYKEDLGDEKWYAQEAVLNRMIKLKRKCTSNTLARSSSKFLSNYNAVLGCCALRGKHPPGSPLNKSSSCRLRVNFIPTYAGSRSKYNERVKNAGLSTNKGNRSRASKHYSMNKGGVGVAKLKQRMNEQDFENKLSRSRLLDTSSCSNSFLYSRDQVQSDDMNKHSELIAEDRVPNYANESVRAEKNRAYQQGYFFSRTYDIDKHTNNIEVKCYNQHYTNFAPYQNFPTIQQANCFVGYSPLKSLCCYGQGCNGGYMAPDINGGYRPQSTRSKISETINSYSSSCYGSRKEEMVNNAHYRVRNESNAMLRDESIKSSMYSERSKPIRNSIHNNKYGFIQDSTYNNSYAEYLGLRCNDFDVVTEKTGNNNSINEVLCRNDTSTAGLCVNRVCGVVKNPNINLLTGRLCRDNCFDVTDAINKFFINLEKANRSYEFNTKIIQKSFCVFSGKNLFNTMFLYLLNDFLEMLPLTLVAAYIFLKRYTFKLNIRYDDCAFFIKYFLVSCFIVQKSCSDFMISNHVLAEQWNLNVSEVNYLEAQMLLVTDYSTHVSCKDIHNVLIDELYFSIKSHNLKEEFETFVRAYN